MVMSSRVTALWHGRSKEIHRVMTNDESQKNHELPTCPLLAVVPSPSVTRTQICAQEVRGASFFVSAPRRNLEVKSRCLDLQAAAAQVGHLGARYVAQR